MDVTIFYIDLQISGKFAGALLNEALDKGVTLRQGVPGEITDHDGRLEVIVESQGLNHKQAFDRVILSIGQRPNPDRSMIDQIGLSQDNFGFVRSKSTLDATRTKVQGVYLAGTCCGPKDIEATLEHAGQTAEAIMADLRKGNLR
jgi:heterodisulfide reductase subunit A